MADQLSASIVRILGPKGTAVGAGFLVANRQVLTCAHVVAQALALSPDYLDIPQAQVQLDLPLIALGRIFNARIVFWQPPRSDGGADMAGLELEGNLPTAAQSARLVKADDLWGHPFRALGFPAGHDDGVWATGVLRGRQATGWVQIEDVKGSGYRVQPGFSGAPVWDEELDGVAGMTVAAESRPEIKAAFIIPVDVLVKAWPELGERTSPPCPYRGLFAFREQDAPLFFGREVFINRLVEAVQRQCLVAVIGPSGCGKSSIIFAGLLPHLRREADRLIAPFRPGARPFHALAASLVPTLEPDMSETERLIEIRRLADALEQGNLGLSEVVVRILQKSPEVHRLVLIVDQFEELYTLCSDPEMRRRFVDRLLEAVQVGHEDRHLPDVTLVLTLRADFLGNSLTYRPLADALQDANLVLGPMTRQELRQAIENPAAKQGLTFEPGLVERILDDVGSEPGNLPLLEFALTSLWKQSSGQLTHAAYEAIGRVQGALTCYADSEFEGLSQTEQLRAQRVFMQMVRPGDGVQDTRRLATRAELGEDDWRLVQRLADARLVVTDRDPAGQETAEIVHETLLRSWRQLRDWMEADRFFRAWQEKLRVGLGQWLASGRDEGALLRGVPLVQAERWLAERQDDLGLIERRYIRESIVLRTRDLAAQKRELVLLSLVAGLLGGGLGGAVGTIIHMAVRPQATAGILGPALGNGFFGALFASGISLAISLCSTPGVRKRIRPIVGGVAAGTVLGSLGQLMAQSLGMKSPQSFLLGALVGALFGGSLALSIVIGTRFGANRRSLVRALIGACGGALVGATFELPIPTSFVGLGVALGLGIAHDRFPKSGA
jgi:energy-coupling factor transporter ATP-binding protein EcfA2